MGPPVERTRHPHVYSYGFSNIDLTTAISILPALRGVELVGGLTPDQQRDMKEVRKVWDLHCNSSGCCGAALDRLHLNVKQTPPACRTCRETFTAELRSLMIASWSSRAMGGSL
jgi:hypothetical protein